MPEKPLQKDPGPIDISQAPGEEISDAGLVRSHIRILYAYGLHLQTPALRRAWNKKWENLEGPEPKKGKSGKAGKDTRICRNGWSLEPRSVTRSTQGDVRFLTTDASALFGDSPVPDSRGFRGYEVKKTHHGGDSVFAALPAVSHIHLHVFSGNAPPKPISESDPVNCTLPSWADWQAENRALGKVSTKEIQLWLTENGILYLVIDVSFTGTTEQVRDLTYLLSFTDKKDRDVGFVQAKSCPRSPGNPQPEALKFHSLDPSRPGCFQSALLEELGFGQSTALQTGRSFISVYHFIPEDSPAVGDPWVSTPGFAGRFLPAKAEPYEVDEDAYFDTIRFNGQILCHVSSEGVVATGIGREGSLTSQYAPRFHGQYFLLLMLAYHQAASLGQLVRNLSLGRRSRDRNQSLFWDVLYEDYVDALNRYEVSKASTMANSERFYQGLRTCLMVKPLQERLYQAFDLNLNKEDRDETSALNSIVLFSVVLTMGGLIASTAQVLPTQAPQLLLGGAVMVGLLVIGKWTMTATVIRYWLGYRNRATVTARKRGRR